MSTHKNFNLICIVSVLLAAALTVACLAGTQSGIIVTANAMGYENRLFDTSKVHTIDLVMDDWDTFIASCQREEYSVCTAVIDGEKYGNVGIRGKGNTSLSNVASMGSERYSFKLEFDQYENGKSYYGLDKLCLNNLIQDNTYMKDYLAYRMMAEFGADTPLCSYVYITVNGEDWGLYLAVEGVEDGFLQRSYGTDYGELYKPDSLSFGGGRGNGKDFNMENFDFGDFDPSDLADMIPQDDENAEQENSFTHTDISDIADFFSGNMPQMPSGGDFDPSSIPAMPNGEMPDAVTSASPEGEESTDDARSKEVPTMPDGAASSDDAQGDTNGKDFSSGGKGFSFGMGSSDVKLAYIDDDSDSYPNIFNNAKTEITAADQTRLIASLKSLSAYEDLEDVLDIDEVLRYFVVHNFTVNGDSYTGSMIHNYYLYEEDGKLSMIPWDYNLAFGTFQGGSASSSVNDPIDDALTDRPMQSWIFSDEQYTQQYHALYAEFLESVDIEGIIDEAYALIAPYVEKDPTAFCTYDEFEAGVAALRTFCALRTQSVAGQLDGTIPSTSEAQSADSSALTDASALTISDMGTMSTGGGFGGGQMPNRNTPDSAQSEPDKTGGSGQPSDAAPDIPEMPSGDMPEMPSGGQTQGFDGQMPAFDGQMPGGKGGTPPEMPSGGTAPAQS